MSKEPNENSSWMRRLLDFLEDDGESLESTEDDWENTGQEEEIEEREEEEIEEREEEEEEEEIEEEEEEGEQEEEQNKKTKTKASRKRGRKMPAQKRSSLSRKRTRSSAEARIARKKKSKRSEGIFSVLFRIIVGVMFIGAAAFGVSFLINPREKVDETLQRYAQYINEREYEKMYEMLDSDTKQKVSKEAFVNRNKRIYRGIDAVDAKIDVKSIKRVESGKRQVEYTMSMKTLAGDVTFDHTITVIKGEERDYDIVWDDSMIFPDLTSEDKVNVTTETAKRGNILDRNDIELAKEVTRYKVILDKSKLSEDTMSTTLYEISSIVGKGYDEIKAKIEKVEEDEKVTIAKLSEDDVTARASLEKLSYITLEEISERIYPYGKYTAHVVGYIQKITADEREKHKGEGYSSNALIGKRGVEKLFESRLRAKDGHRIEILDSNGKVKTQVARSEKEDGENIKLTIDISTQVNAFLQFQNDKSCTVAINPNTGEVLALASTPVYNPNKFITGFTQEEWDELQNAEGNPLYSRYQSIYCPGSSFKPITAAIGLDTGAFTADENFGYTGTSWQKDSSWGKRTITTLHEYGSEVILKNALIYSDNIYFARAALKIGGDRFLEEVRKLGFYERPDFDFSLEPSVVTEDENGNLNADQQLADTGYGQAQVLVNPVHIASVYSAFLNEGNMIRPYLEYKENAVPTYAIENAFTPETANTIKEDLIQVVESVHGTAHSAKVNGKTIGGKTGTAELKMTQDDETGTELGWFNAFLLDPNGDHSKDILVISMVEDVKGRGGSGYVVPRVRNILANYGVNVAQRYANVYTGEDDEEKEEWGSRGSTVYSYKTTTAATTAVTTATTTQSSTASTQTTSSAVSTTSTTSNSTAASTQTSTNYSSQTSTSSTTSTSLGTSTTGSYGSTDATAGTVGTGTAGTVGTTSTARSYGSYEE